ncbi:MAG: hypothetical protein PHI18_00215 [bacterium]|nr:hypothetical protein [bacterium]
MIVTGNELWPGDVLLTRFPSRYWPPSVDLVKWWGFKRALHDAQKQLYPHPLNAKALWNTHGRILDTQDEWFSGTTPVAVKERLNPEQLDHPWVIVRYRFQENWGPVQLETLQRVIDENVGKGYDVLQLFNIWIHILFPNLPPEWRILDEGLDQRVCTTFIGFILTQVWKTTDRSTVRPLEGRYVENVTPACFQNYQSLMADGSRDLTFVEVCRG